MPAALLPKLSAHPSPPEEAAASWLARDLPPAIPGLCTPEILIGAEWRAKLPREARTVLQQAMTAELAPTWFSEGSSTLLKEEGKAKKAKKSEQQRGLLPMAPWLWPFGLGSGTEAALERAAAKGGGTNQPKKAKKDAKAKPVEDAFKHPPLVDASSKQPPEAVPIADRPDEPDPSADLDLLGGEGWVEQWVPAETPLGCPRLLLAGAPCADDARRRCPDGALHGAVELLTTHFGLRYWAPGVTAREAPSTPLPLPLPKAPPLWPTGARRRASPQFFYREVYGVTANKFPAWAAAQHLQGGFDGGEEGNTNLVFAKPPGGVHTAFKLAPRELAAHYPRWYGGDQLCWLADGLPEYLLKRAQELLDEQHKRRPTVISISQDDNMTPCTRGRDAEVAEEEGSMMAPLLRAVNFIADALAKSHPGVWVDTLAYQHTQALPRTTRPRPNVLIRLATIFADFVRPLDDPSAPRENQEFARDLRAWAAARREQPEGRRFRLAIWDYGVNFRHWLLPFPNWESAPANFRFYAEQGVEGVFMEANYKAPGGELEPLKSYLYAQLLRARRWEPTADPKALIGGFLTGYYGAAGGAVGEYIAHYTAAARRAGAHMNIFAEPNHALFTRDAVLQGAAHMADAQAAVANEGGELARRARIASLSARYTLLLDWHRLLAHADRLGVAWPDETRDARAALRNFEAIYREAGMHEALPPERDTPDPTSDIGLSEQGNGLAWLRGVVGSGQSMEMALERQPPPRHAAFGHGPYTPPVRASRDLERRLHADYSL